MFIPSLAYSSHVGMTPKGNKFMKTCYDIKSELAIGMS